MYYVLADNGQPVLIDNPMAWGKWMMEANRAVCKTTVKPGIDVSTVFLGIDHNFGGGAPVLWETMIFGGAQDGYQERYSSEQEAREGHARAVDLARSDFVWLD